MNDLIARLERMSVPEPNSGCWLWLGATSDGGHGIVYGSISIAGKKVAAHRAAWVAYEGPIAPGIIICHRCDNGLCINPAHLFPGSHADNVDDCWQKARSHWNRDNTVARQTLARARAAIMILPKGEANGRSKLTEADIPKIRAAVASGQRQRSIARDFGVGQSAISEIISGRKWRHV